MAAEVDEQQEPVRGFIVDTHLLRELGDLLVGRDSTAILELVKNGYDADATVVRIEAQNLNDPAKAVLVVSDNGTGMTVERFESAFMRIAGRAKESGDRKSDVFERAYTGQKGIGRLASQKLANELEVVSVPAPVEGSRPNPGVRARLDWSVIDEQDRLDQLKRGLQIDALLDESTRPVGTTLTMRRLKRQWSADEITLFVNELRTALPPGAVVDIADDLLAGSPLFTAPQIRTSKENDLGFDVKFGGDLTTGDDLWQQATDRFDWCIEVDVAAERVHYQVTPTQRYAGEAPTARRYNFKATAPAGLSFQARFFFMPNASSRGPLGGFTRAQSGIRVYLEGFRVLPYGEFSDDWLGTDIDYRSGPRLYTIDIDEENSDEVITDADEALNATSSVAFYGAVFLTTAGAPDLESLINREGFVPSATFQAIRDITRDALRLSVRVRRSMTLQAKALRDAALTYDSEELAPASGRVPAPRVDTRPVESDRVSYGLMANRGPSEATRQTIDHASEAVTRLIGSGLDQADKSTDLASLADGFQAAREALSSVQAVQPELRTLAGVGLQLGAFVHDINGMLASVTTIRELLASVINDTTDRKHRSRLQIILGSADELAHVLTRQSSYLTDVLSADPRRRRSRIVVRDRVDSVLRFLAGRALERHLAVHVNVDDGLKTPPMFPSEVMILLTNLLTNAVKNAETTIWIDASADVGGNTVIIISNDGVRVDLSESERWFLPFESTTTNVDEVLGQGLGLGLPIVRAIADDYGGDVRFVQPAHGSTAVQVWLKRKDLNR